MAKSNFSALVEAKRSRDSQTALSDAEDLQNSESVESKVEEKEFEQKVVGKAERSKSKPNENNEAEQAKKETLETVRRSYRIETSHDKAVKVTSKFMEQGTEEEIVMKIFKYYFENNSEGKKAMQMVEMLNKS
ncbi:MAG: hypothetical protein H7Z37_07010 [Pyrinomonadaceae bacterium]|nr:hypothetical protein [Pyrinomonadaceae bacterium]